MCQGTLLKVLVRKNNNFVEFKVHLIHRKQVPLLHNTVLILCYEGAGLVAIRKSYIVIHVYTNLTTKNSSFFSNFTVTIKIHVIEKLMKKSLLRKTHSLKIYEVGTHWNCIFEVIPMCNSIMCY